MKFTYTLRLTFAVLIACIVSFMASAIAPAAAQSAKADRAVIAACIEKATEASSFGGECVGLIADPCLKDTTDEKAALACAKREEVVWLALQADALKAVKSGGFAEITKAVVGAQKSWQASRDALCPVLDTIDLGMYPGGSAYCRLQEAARRTLTLIKLGAAVNEH